VHKGVLGEHNSALEAFRRKCTTSWEGMRTAGGIEVARTANAVLCRLVAFLHNVKEFGER